MASGHEATEPLYKQLAETLRQEIEGGKYKKGERFPTEFELSDKHGVSRITVRSALNELSRENYLVRYRRRGTFVTGEKLQRSIAKLSSFSDMCREQGRTPGAKVIKSVYEKATARDQEELGLEPGARVVVIERIRYADKVPVSVEISRFSDQYAFLLDENLNDTSLYEQLKAHCGISLVSSNKTIELMFASYELAQYLGLADGYPLISIGSVVSDLEGHKVHRSRQYIVGDKFKLII